MDAGVISRWKLSPPTFLIVGCLPLFTYKLYFNAFFVFKRVHARHGRRRMMKNICEESHGAHVDPITKPSWKVAVTLTYTILSSTYNPHRSNSADLPLICHRYRCLPSGGFQSTCIVSRVFIFRRPPLNPSSYAISLASSTESACTCSAALRCRVAFFSCRNMEKGAVPAKGGILREPRVVMS